MPTEISNHSDVVDIFGLLIRCPFGDEDAACPFKSLRRDLSLEEKFRVAEFLAITPMVYQQMYKGHAGCYGERLDLVNFIKPPWQYLDNQQLDGQSHKGQATETGSDTLFFRQGVARQGCQW